MFIKAIHGPKNPKKSHKDVKFETLESYLKMAKVMICYFIPKINRSLTYKMINSEDGISMVAESLMWADAEFDKDYEKNKGRPGRTLKSYRLHRAYWAILEYSNKRVNNIYLCEDMYTTEDLKIDTVVEEEEKKFTHKMLDNSKLTTKQKDHITKRYVDEMSICQIADEYKVDRRAIYQSIKKGLLKMKRKWQYEYNS